MTKLKKGKQLVGLWSIPQMLENFRNQGLNEKESHKKMIKQIFQSFQNFEKNNLDKP